jgi:hypothetical protein
MENKENILQELREISEVVANLPKGNTFAVPSTYFEEFPGSVLARIEAESFDLGSKTTPFGVPNGYFDGLAGNILNKIKEQEQTVEEELNELAPLLNTISKKPVYTVPDGYFESLEITIPLKVASPPAKVFSLGKPKRVLQYAIAACTAGILMVGAYLYSGRTPAQTDGAVATISYDSAMKMDVNQELAKVDEQTIDQYLAETPITGYIINTVAPEEVDPQQLINGTTEEDINEYLQETADPSEETTGS